MVWEPSKCCCCLTPRTGTLVLGYLGAISAVCALITSISKTFISREDSANRCNFANHVMNPDDCQRAIINSAIIGAVEEIIRAAICIMLILGVNKNNHCLMLPYMIYQVLGIVLGSLGFLALVIFFAVFRAWIFSIVFLVIGALVIFLITFFFLVVRVCYKEVRNESHRMSGGGIEVGPINPNKELPPPSYKM